MLRSQSALLNDSTASLANTDVIDWIICFEFDCYRDRVVIVQQIKLAKGFAAQQVRRNIGRNGGSVCSSRLRLSAR